MVIAVILVRYVLLPVIGIGVVKAAGSLGFLPSDPLYHYVLMVQFALPPAMNIGNKCSSSSAPTSLRMRFLYAKSFYLYLSFD